MSDETLRKARGPVWPIGSCPECYDAGTPERPVCDPHGHDLMFNDVIICEAHPHAVRVAPAPTRVDEYVRSIEEMQASDDYAALRAALRASAPGDEG